MNVIPATKETWPQIKDIYLEAFPKAERKPVWTLRRSSKRGKLRLLTAMEGAQILGFVGLIPFGNLVMVDYLAVNQSIRGKGTGSRLLQAVAAQYPGKTIVLLIEQPDEKAENQQQRLDRRRFYMKNGFCESGLRVDGVSGKMEVLCRGGEVLPEEYLQLQEYALGKLFFRLSKIHLVE